MDVDDGGLAEPADGGELLVDSSSVDGDHRPATPDLPARPAELPHGRARAGRPADPRGPGRRSRTRARRRGSGAGGRRPSGAGHPRAGSATAGSRGERTGSWHPGDGIGRCGAQASGEAPQHGAKVAAGRSRARRRRAPERAGSNACERGAQAATPPSAAMRRPARATLPARMATTAEARTFRAARRPGAMELITSGFPGDLVPPAAHPLPRPRRPQEARLRHPPRQRLVDPRPAPPDGRLRRPRLGHLPDVKTDDYPLFVFAAILPWKWFSSAVNDGIVVGDLARADHQAGQVPQDRPAGRRRRRAASSASCSG